MPFFKDVLGQEEAKRQLIQGAKTGKLAHALLLSGPAGSGKLPLALATARYLLCQHPHENDACGECPSCAMMNRLAHPDLHLPFLSSSGKPDATLYAMTFSLNGEKCFNANSM